MKSIKKTFFLMAVIMLYIISVSSCSLPFSSDARTIIRIALDKDYIEKGDSDKIYHSEEDILYGMVIYSLDSNGEFIYLNNSDEAPEGLSYTFSKKKAMEFFDLIDSYGIEEYTPFSLTENNELITEYKSKTICIGNEIVVKDGDEYIKDQFNYKYYLSDNYGKIIDEFEKLKKTAE